MNNLSIYNKISLFIGVFTNPMMKKIAKLFDGQGDVRLIDLLLYLPSRYAQYIGSVDVSESLAGSDVSIFAKVEQHGKPLHFKGGGRAPYSISILTKSEKKIVLKFFRYNSSYLDKFAIGKVIKIRGKLTMYKGVFIIIHPSLLEVLDDFPSEILQEKSEIIPIYSLKDGVSKADVLKIITLALNLFLAMERDFKMLTKDNTDMVFSLKECINILHNPKNQEDVSKALSQLAFEEFIASFFAISHARKILDKQKIKKKPIDIDTIEKKILLENFGYELTGDQKNALCEIEKSQKSGDKFFTLIQGDVGSGKTIVALILALNSVKSGGQVLFLAPTTILVNQHFELSKKLFDRANIKTELLTSKIGVKKRREILSEFKGGEIDILFGTHSLLSSEVISKNLEMIVIDEQHRFGVKQRLDITEKSKDASVLMLSATPIPRSLAMGMYGDIEVLKITEKPSFQKPIITTIVDISKYDELLEKIEKKIESGDRVYWVCHLIEGEEEDEKIGVLKRFKKICERIDESRVGFLHGKMKEDEKNDIISRFSGGEILVLISTTVVEVGVNVPEATVIVIENADMFGLAQLHQLRGRVGRGDKQSYCILLFDKQKGDCKRLDIIKDSTDGFEIAKKDMKIRGIGNILGIEQSGDVGYRVANIGRDFEVMKDAMEFAKKSIKEKRLDTDEEFCQITRRVLQTFFPYDYEKFLKG